MTQSEINNFIKHDKKKEELKRKEFLEYINNSILLANDEKNSIITEESKMFFAGYIQAMEDVLTQF